MDPKSKKLFAVTRQEPELIIPARPTPREVKQLSDLDNQERFRFHMPVIFFYRNNPSPSVKGKDPFKVIREALSKALVFYYPVAGRLREGPSRKLMVDCNAEGILFLEADANVNLEQLGGSIHPPFPYLDEVLYDPGSRGIIDCPLLFIQVTRLTCGGIILAMLVNHTIFDASGLIQFLKTVMEFARGANSPSLMPVWQREFLSARDSPPIACIHHEPQKISESNDAQPNTEPIEEKSFFFGPKEISAIRKSLPLHLRNCTTFELSSACIWKCRTTALKLEPSKILRFSCPVNIRSMHYKIQRPPGYYGNAFAVPSVLTTVDDLCKNPLGYTVELVKKAKAKMNEEYVKSLADIMLLMAPPIYLMEERFAVSSVTGLGFEEIDFGWGKPVYAGAAAAKPNVSFHMKYQNKDGEDGILVVLCMPQPTMKRFEKELKKITQELSVEDLDKMKMKMKSTKILSKF